MDYEKKYKDALANARQEYTTTENVERKQWLEELFPELKESEYERIRKRLIDLIYKVYAFTNYITCVEYENIIAWLEKQGDTTSDIRYDGVNAGASLSVVNGNSFDYEKATITQKDDERIRKELINVFSNRGKYLIDQSFGDITVSEALAWLKKQGEQKPIISVAYMVSKYASTPEQGNKGFGKPINCMVRAYRQGILDTLKKIKENNVVEEQQNTTEQNTQKFVTEDKSLSDKHQWEDGDIIRLKNDDGVRWQIFKSPESEINEEWFMSQIMENGIAGGYVSSLILDTKYEFLYNPHKEFLKKH